MRGNWRKWAAALTVGLTVSVAPAQAPPKDLVDTTKQKLLANEAALTIEVAESVRTSSSLAKSGSPELAVRKLKELSGRVAVAIVSETKRTELIKQLDDAIASINGTPAKPVAPKYDPAIAERVIKSEKNQKLVEAAKQETKEVDEAISGIAKDVDAGRTADAQKKLAAIAAKYPNNPAVFYLQGQQTYADAIQAARDLTTLSADRFRRAGNDLLASAIPPVGDIEYPKDFIEKGKRIKKLFAPKLSAEEEKLLKSLDTPIKGGLKDAPFEEAVQLISTAIDQKIYLDKKSLEDQGVNLGQKVDVPGGVSARSALRVMLQSQNLTFLIRDNIIQVVSLERAREMMVSRAYDVRDLVSVGGPFNGPYTWGPLLDAQQTHENARVLVEAIQKGIDPKVWKETAGGPATIAFHYPTMSIIVRAPSEVHADLYEKMNPSRK
jgi:hypothetical protein